MNNTYRIKLEGRDWQEISEDTPIESLDVDCTTFYGVSQHPGGIYAAFVISDKSIQAGLPRRSLACAEQDLKRLKERDRHE